MQFDWENEVVEDDSPEPTDAEMLEEIKRVEAELNKK